MKTSRWTNHLRLLFVIAVLAPCAVLSILAVRSIDREEAYVEKRFQESLDAELSQAVTSLRTEIERMAVDLASNVPPLGPGDSKAALAGWKVRTPLIRVPFLLSADLRILWPRLDARLSPDEIAFLNWNRDFVTDRAPTAYYQNVALLYKDEIAGPAIPLNSVTAKPETPPAGSLDKKASAPQTRTAGAGVQSAGEAARIQIQAGPETKQGLALDTRSKIEEIDAEQKALNEFEQNASARKRIFDAAAEKGQRAQPRTVTPGPGTSAPAPAGAARTESIYISEPRKFSQIASGRDHGLIPRFLDEKLVLLFWKRAPAGRFVGALLADEEVKGRLLGALSDAFTPARILTVLDESGRPLIMPSDAAARDWRRPLSAREISEVLPRWEAAAYATDPGAIASRARSTRYLLGLVIAGLFVSVAAGGTVILNALRREMVLARQKTTFVANVSHELKTPLTSIRMFAEMLKEGRQPDADKRRTYLGLMVAETERLTRLINNVLDFSRMEKGRRSYVRTAVDAAALVRELAESQRPRLEHNGFRLTLAAGDPVWVMADAEAIKQAVLNLLSNAEKYSAECRDVEIEASADGDTAVIAIRDRGIGVPPGEGEKIFKEFYRIDQSLTARVRGTGLGLTIARRIVRDHGGDIAYAPRPGGGSVFRLILPRKKDS